MNKELREAVAGKFREMATLERLRSGPFTWDELADAALSIALEEAANAIYSVPRWDHEIFDSFTVQADGFWVRLDEAEAAIRALKESV